ncbi:TspO/MBR family protein [Paraburkholderia aromaticivorans]|uniref:TspO/MBR family protein n=1 Tax=Paraburkholderia aromaticivorans TaxID=2026199 RepID=UPI0012FDEE2C|nr:TspO/MBR family protein [Paraburkholderia aromaticivorans]
MRQSSGSEGATALCFGYTHIKAGRASSLRRRPQTQIAAGVEKAELAADQANTATVNQTMQVEARADHWRTYAWRPFVGFCFGFAWIGAYFIIPVLRGWWPNIAQPSFPPEAWIAIGGVLGVASFFRGKMQANPTISADSRG